MSATMAVDENGVIRSVEATYRLRDDGVGEYAYEMTDTIDDIGSVAVEELACFSTAQEQAPTVTASVTDDDQFIRFVVESGNRLEAGTRLVVGAEGDEPGFYHVLEDAIEPNTPVYVSRQSDGSKAGAVAR